MQLTDHRLSLFKAQAVAFRIRGQGRASNMPSAKKLTDSGIERAHHEKGGLLGEPILVSALGSLVKFADAM